MLDSRVRDLAKLVCTHSTELGPDDKVLIHAFDIPEEAIAAFVEAAQAQGAQTAVRIESGLVRRSLLKGISDDNLRLIADGEAHEMENMTAYIGLRGGDNAMQTSDVPQDRMEAFSRLYAKPVVFERRVPNTKWAVMRWPSGAMAQSASMSTPAFEDFYFDVCLADYAGMGEAMKPLQERMEKCDIVQLKGPDTDLTFSIKDVGAVPCFGKRNIPDGECFSAPVLGSANGRVQYNTSSLNQGIEFKNIWLEVKDGVITDAGADGHVEKLTEILDTDEGARRFGEFAIGVNNRIQHPMLDTLFDEKIGGSFHLTPGNSYDPPGGNGNVSAIHWDIVCIQREDYGGGEIWFDGEQIRKDGIFVPADLHGLNP